MSPGKIHSAKVRHTMQSVFMVAAVVSTQLSLRRSPSFPLLSKPIGSLKFGHVWVYFLQRMQKKATAKWSKWIHVYILRGITDGGESFVLLPSMRVAIPSLFRHIACKKQTESKAPPTKQAGGTASRHALLGKWPPISRFLPS